MNGFSVWEMIETIANLVLSSPFFLSTLIISTILLIAMIISIKKTKKIGKVLTIVIYVFLILFVFIYYNSYLFNLLDNFMNTIFTQIFFPNLATYLLMLICTTIMLFYSLFKSDLARYVKIINMLFSSVILFLFVLTLDTIVNNKINIYEPLTIYSKKALLITIEFTMILFVIWILLLFSIKTINKLIKKSNDKINKEFLDNHEEKAETLKL